MICCEPTFATTLVLPCEKNPAQPTDPMKVIMIATTITLVVLPDNPSLMLCIPDIFVFQLKKARLLARSL